MNNRKVLAVFSIAICLSGRAYAEEEGTETEGKTVVSTTIGVDDLRYMEDIRIEKKNLGIGVELGWPSGVSGKYFFNETIGVQFGVGIGGVSLINTYGHAVISPVSVKVEEIGTISLYAGTGLSLGVIPLFGFEDPILAVPVGAAIELPIGISLDLDQFEDQPIEIFSEFGYGLSIIPGIGSYAIGKAGIRYYF
jgi:hypothetical protein